MSRKMLTFSILLRAVVMVFSSSRKQSLGPACFNSSYKHVLQAVFELKPQVFNLFGRETDNLQVVVDTFEPENQCLIVSMAELKVVQIKCIYIYIFDGMYERYVLVMCTYYCPYAKCHAKNH